MRITEPGAPASDGRETRSAGGQKTEHLARATINPATLAKAVTGFAAARAILRSPDVVQAGSGARGIDRTRPEEMSLFYLDGEPHRQRRAAIAPFFTLRAITSRYQMVMDDMADRLVAEIASGAEVRLDKIAFRFAVAVAAEVLGLDHADLDGLTGRIEATIALEGSERPIREQHDEAVRAYYEQDILPAIDARRRNRRDDVISRLLDAGCSDNLIATEVRGYSFAGMVTTRELIVMCAWYLVEHPALAERFRASDRRTQMVIVEEILRLEPIVGYIKRKAAVDLDLPGCPRFDRDATITIDVRAANNDRDVAGACPHLIDPDRATTVPGSGYMSFGDGPHRCPGAQLALAEARTFLDRLLRLPDLAFTREPNLTWFKAIASYVFLDAHVRCGPGSQSIERGA